MFRFSKQKITQQRWLPSTKCPLQNPSQLQTWKTHHLPQRRGLRCKRSARASRKFPKRPQMQQQKKHTAIELSEVNLHLPWEPTFPSFLGVITHISGVFNLHFSWFWGPRVSSNELYHLERIDDATPISLLVFYHGPENLLRHRTWEWLAIDP